MKNQEYKYCFLDTETTGLSSNARIIELSAIFTDENFNIMHEINMFSMPLTGNILGSEAKKAAEIHGIDADQLWDLVDSQCGSPRASWEKLFDIIKSNRKNMKLVIQNSGFDIRMLAYEALDRKYLNILDLPRAIDLPSYIMGITGEFLSLKNMCEKFGVTNTDPHRSRGDAIAMIDCIKAAQGLRS